MIAAGDEQKNGPKYQLVQWSIDWEQFTWRPTLKELTRWKDIRVGRSMDKSIGKT
jgi:hypothetical protein